MARTFDVRIDLKYGKDLPIGDFVSSDPYVEIDVPDYDLPKYKSFVQFNTLNPIWDETINYLGMKDSVTFNFKVKDKDFGITRDDTLGKFELAINSQDFKLDQPKEVQQPIGRKGTLVLEVTLCNSGYAGAPVIRGPVRCRKHLCPLSGMVTNNSSFSTYKMFLHSVAEIMGNKKQEWNKNYAAAKKIFNSPVVMSTIRTQHSGLYKSDPADITTTLDSPEEFFELLDNGERDNESRYYTYVILEDSMRFSETGTAFFNDMLSKHALHASAATEVYYAGEFCIIKNEHGPGHTLVIDNNSGTYAPDAAQLPNLAELIKVNFPGMSVETIDFKADEARLTQLHQRCPSRLKMAS